MEAARLQVTVGADTRSAEAALSSFDQKLKSVASSMTKTGAAMTLGLTTPLVAGAKKALGMAADYEQTMNVLQVATGATDKAMAKMSERAMQLGAETSFSAGEAAEGMLELGKAGMNASQIYDAMPGVLALAAAGQISVAEASAVTASTLNAFNLEASESTRIADLLAGAANASQANISDLSQGMQQAGFAFKLANQPVEYLAASLALLTDQGLTGSDAGTALKNAMMGMINPTNEAKAEMDRLGISFYDANGNMKQMPDIIGMLDTALDGMTNQQRDSAMSTMFLGDAMKALTPLLEAGKDGFDETVAKVTEVGAATKVSDALMRGLGGGIEYLSGSVETFLLGAGLPFTTTLGDWARALGDAITAFGELPQETQNLALGILAVVAAAGPAILIVGTLAGALSAIGLTAGLAILGVAGLGVAWGMNLGGIRDKTAEIVPVIQEWFSGLSTDVAAVATAISTAFSNTTFPTIDELWADFQAGDAQLVATKIADAAGELIVNLNTELKITGTIDALKTKLQGFVSQLTADVSSLDFGEAGSKIAEKINGLTTAINELDLSGIDWRAVLTRILLGPLGAAINAIVWVVNSTEFEGLKKAVTAALSTIPWGEIGASFSGLATAVGTQLSKVFADIGTDLGIKPIDLSGWMTAMADSINSQDWTELGRNIVKGIGAGIVGALSLDVTWAENFANGFAAQVRGGLANVEWGELNTAFSALAEAVRQAIYDVFGGMGKELTPIIESMNTSFSTAMETLGAAIRKSISTTVSGWNTDFSTAMETLGAQIRAAIASAFLNLIPDWLGGGGGDGGDAGGGGAPSPNLLEDESRIGSKKGKYSLRPPTDTQAAPEPLDWAKYVKPLDWLAYVKPFNWQQVTQPLAWQQFVQRLEWQTFVQPITWSQFVQMLNWSGYVARLSWNSFVSALGWNSYVGDLDWGSFVDKLDWGRFIDSVKVGSNAAGTSNWRGGLTWVGEEGAEIVDLPRGSRIYSNEESMAMTSGMTVNISVASLNNDIDIASLAMKVAREIARRTR